MDAATIEETNRIRVSLGMKPLPVPGAAPTQSQRDNSASDDEDAPSTLESRSAQAYENYQKVRDAEAAKRRREERAAAAKREREAAQRHAILEGKSLGEAEDADVDAKAWLKAQKKRQKAIDKARKLEEEQAAAEAAALAAVEYTSKDLAGVKVAHELDNFLDGDEQILTLKDATIDQNEEEGDELENMDLRAKEKLQEHLDLKKKKPAYDVFAAADEGAERGILAQYDDEIYGKKGKKFTLDGSGAITALGDILGAPEKSKKLQNIDLDALQDAPTSDYLDISEIKVKKPKKKKSKSTRQKPVDEDDIFPIDITPTGDDMMDLDSGAPVLQKKRKIEDDTFVDDEDLQASLAIQRKNALKKRKRARPEDIARQLREQVDEPGEAQMGGVVIDEISEFVSNLKKPEEEEERKPKRPKSVSVEPVTAMDAESGDEDHPMGEDDIHETLEDRTREDSADVAATGVDEEKTMNTGMGSTLALLRERGILKDARGAELNMSQRQKAEFLAEKRRIEREQEERTKSQRERDRNSGRLDAMSTRDREERARQANAHRELQQSRVVDELFKKHYKPKVELKYVDDHGRSLDQKEAFKHMSHQFHGKGSGKGKTDKLLKKIEEEKRREAKPTFDASENANMSSSSAKRQAGVRLQ
ncbi:U4/U6.U5 tri-snRNP-associated protein snu66 [Colletotrichum tanaceti]|uniref:U4/U6.U5 tri-snRNP-associated protein snu66 n=1 Tax=Colletotrichum tanaceti TaxID=1306861 RepID=A0A4U6XU05_9PEZI|nr:U4/U6.U5 tri-snRNP-associated protein snu66 [Colletotrichum tanaceti]TKW59371.1 U4/U6.U5 tri-snRNP-associated protein snu66 [Colletotrichum tanaceti]